MKTCLVAWVVALVAMVRVEHVYCVFANMAGKTLLFNGKTVTAQFGFSQAVMVHQSTTRNTWSCHCQTKILSTALADNGRVDMR